MAQIAARPGSRNGLSLVKHEWNATDVPNLGSSQKKRRLRRRFPVNPVEEIGF
jgi:hypothetical protein